MKHLLGLDFRPVLIWLMICECQLDWFEDANNSTYISSTGSRVLINTGWVNSVVLEVISIMLLRNEDTTDLTTAHELSKNSGVHGLEAVGWALRLAGASSFDESLRFCQRL